MSWFQIDGRRVIASISGGKDSAALSLMLTEQGIEHDRVFQDTGWEHPATLEYLRGDLTRAIGPITEIRAPLQMRDLILRKGMFPSRGIRFCTEELKIFPMRDYIRSLDEDVVNAVGIRQEESKARANALEWEYSKTFDCDVWRPLIHWTVQDVIDIHRRHNLRPNPLYLWGAERVGCWPCINSRKSEIRMLAARDPGRIAEIAELETQVAAATLVRWGRDREAWIADPPPKPTDPDAIERWNKKFARLFERPFSPPAFFQDSFADAEGRYPCRPIAEVVRWSQTKRGGKQIELFAGHAHDAGCARWGLCDQPSLRMEAE